MVSIENDARQKRMYGPDKGYLSSQRSSNRRFVEAYQARAEENERTVQPEEPIKKKVFIIEDDALLSNPDLRKRLMDLKNIPRVLVFQTREDGKEVWTIVPETDIAQKEVMKALAHMSIPHTKKDIG